MVEIRDRIERRPIEALIPYARNSRTHSDEQIEQLMASMREWGWTNPVLVDEDGGIIAGHGRVMAAKRLGLKEVPVIVASGWTEAQKRAYIIADNKLALNAGWDEEALRLEMGDLQELGFDLDLVGFNADELAGLFGQEAGEDPDDEDAGRGESNYKEQYGVIVICSGEAEQERIYSRLTKEGLTCKVVVT